MTLTIITLVSGLRILTEMHGCPSYRYRAIAEPQRIAIETKWVTEIWEVASVTCLEDFR